MVPLEVLSYWTDNGYPVNDIVEAHTVVSHKQEKEADGYLVLKVETLERPLSEADVVEDQTTEWVCSCPAFSFHHNVDLENRRLAEWEPCKHCRKVMDKSRRAKNDENQSTL
jgi:hypothetical protein